MLQYLLIIIQNIFTFSNACLVYTYVFIATESVCKYCYLFSDNMKKKMKEDDDYINNLLCDTQPKWGIDVSKKPKEELPQASFRKLNID